MVKGTFAPEDPLSKEHWLNSFGLATTIFGLKGSKASIGKTGRIGDIPSSKKGNKMVGDATGTADNMPVTEILSTFQVKLNDGISYLNPETKTNVLWTNANATKHMGEYVSRAGDTSWSIKIRSQAMLESYTAVLNEAMVDLAAEAPGRYFKTYGNWELGINTQTGVVYHARMIR